MLFRNCVDVSGLLLLLFARPRNLVAIEDETAKLIDPRVPADHVGLTVNPRFEESANLEWHKITALIEPHALERTRLRNRAQRREGFLSGLPVCGLVRSAWQVYFITNVI